MLAREFSVEGDGGDPESQQRRMVLGGLWASCELEPRNQGTNLKTVKCMDRGKEKIRPSVRVAENGREGATGNLTRTIGDINFKFSNENVKVYKGVGESTKE